MNYRPPGMVKIAGKLAASIIVLLCVGIVPTRADEIRVAVAANFSATLAEIAEAFEDATGHRVILASGSTGKHYAQIINGAPFDAFFAADAVRPRLLDEAGVGIPNSRYSYALGRLVLWSPQPDLVDDAGSVLSSGKFRHLAIANPRLAPYGAAAQDVLEKLLLWKELQGKLVRGENVNQALQFIHSGNAQLGFVAASQLIDQDYSVTGSHWQVPTDLHEPIRQQAMLLSDTDVARQFMQFAVTSAAERIIENNGYELPQREPEQQ